MNMWMTALALGAKCGCFGAKMLGRADGAARATEAAAPVISDARAILPTPTPHSRKKWRRVISSRWRWAGVISTSQTALVAWACNHARVSLIVHRHGHAYMPCHETRSILRHRFVEIQDGTRDERPGRAFDRIAGAWAGD